MILLSLLSITDDNIADEEGVHCDKRAVAQSFQAPCHQQRPACLSIRYKSDAPVKQMTLTTAS